MDLEQAKRVIARRRWKFAESMPRWPHEYTVRQWEPQNQAEFEDLIRLIRREGTLKSWPYGDPHPRHHNYYLTVGHYEYWEIGERGSGSPIEITHVINRARIEHAQRPAQPPPPPYAWRQLPLFP